MGDTFAKGRRKRKEGREAGGPEPRFCRGSAAVFQSRGGRFAAVGRRPQGNVLPQLVGMGMMTKGPGGISWEACQEPQKADLFPVEAASLSGSVGLALVGWECPQQVGINTL